MPKETKIELPLSLAITVDKILYDKHGTKHDLLFDCTFTSAELSEITELSFDDRTGGLCGCCAGIELLPNLKKLSVKGSQNSSYVLPNELQTIERADISSIQKCQSLESLTIENQARLSILNVSNLPRLVDLNLSDNPNLRRLSGLDKLTRLQYFTCVGNERLFNIDNLDQTIAESEALRHLNLDALLFPSAIGYKVYGDNNQSALDKLDFLSQRGHCTWAQAVVVTRKQNAFLSMQQTIGAVAKHFTMSHLEMIKMHNEACQIINDNANIRIGGKDFIVAMENYLAKNVVYDDNRAQERNTRWGFDNSAFSCLVNKCCVCQGFSRGMQYLLALGGCRSHTVPCIGGIPDKKKMSDFKTKLDRYSTFQPDLGSLHSILCIDDAYMQYCDPCWDSGSYHMGDKTLPYCLLTREEMSHVHTLSLNERGVNAEHIKTSRDFIADSIRCNELFTKTKKAEVETARQRLGYTKPTLVHGMIPTGRN